MIRIEIDFLRKLRDKIFIVNENLPTIAARLAYSKIQRIL
jgi:hypothetical protein